MICQVLEKQRLPRKEIPREFAHTKKVYYDFHLFLNVRLEFILSIFSNMFTVFIDAQRYMFINIVLGISGSVPVSNKLIV